MSLAIFEITEKLKKRLQTNDPFEAARHLNIFVSQRPLNQLKGFYCILNRERHIVINEHLCEEEKRIICAHEMGHDRLHQHLAKKSPFREFALYDRSSRPEYEANLFAADFLLEDTALIDHLKHLDLYHTSLLLKVDPSLVRFKCISLEKRNKLQFGGPAAIEDNFKSSIDNNFEDPVENIHKKAWVNAQYPVPKG